jgi:hypothetical protein
VSSSSPPPSHRERKVPLPRDIDWEALSPRAKETVKKIAVPVSLGLTYKQVASQLSVLTPTGTRPCTESHVSLRMRQLREEIRRQVAPRQYEDQMKR